MKGVALVVLVLLLLTAPHPAHAQCSICTKTVQQLGEKPAERLNLGILYLAAAPLAIVGFLGYRWWKKQPR